MRKLVDDVRLIFKCCSLYYQDGIGQKEICELLGISRPTVSRMLNAGKELGIVKIEIHNPDNLTYGQLERELEKIFGLQEVIIVPSSELPENKNALNPEIGRAALKFLTRILRDKDYVGVTMGSTLQSVARADFFVENRVACTFVPVMGGVGESRPDIHSNYLAQEFADRFGGKCVQLFAPALFSKRTLLEEFLKEQTIQKVTNLFRKLDVLIMGIGVANSEHSTVLHTGYVDHKTLEDFNERGAVGDIILRYFDISGNTKTFDEFNSRVAGIDLNLLKKIPCRVGVAGGEHKIRAVAGAINGGYLTVLITDVDCAQGLLGTRKKEEGTSYKL